MKTSTAEFLREYGPVPDTKGVHGVSQIIKINLVAALVAISFVGMAASPPIRTAETVLEPMPAKLETQFALSALPPVLRDKATVYLLNPKKGLPLHHIYERWIEKFEHNRLGLLRDLKNKLEGNDDDKT
jgi:hypothetical protein